MIIKQAVLAYFKVLSQHFPEWTEENHKTFQPEKPIPRLKFKSLKIITRGNK
jgi:hypothetical protein